MAGITSQINFDNTGNVPLRVPGFGGIGLACELPPEERFAHAMAELYNLLPRLTARELAMIHAMDSVTEKKDWHIRVFNDETVARWREQFQADPMISTEAWNWCVAELRDKAIFYERTKLIFDLDSSSPVCKSDTTVTSTLKSKIKSSFAPLLVHSMPDRQPRSNDQVLVHVDPSLFPLVYNRSKILQDGGQVHLDNLSAAYGEGQIAPDWGHLQENMIRNHVGQAESREERALCGRWSSHFQWLPCEVQFTSKADTDVQITSYINNLHPFRYQPLYQAIEQLISRSIEPWNEVLVASQSPRMPLRIKTYGIEYKADWPEWADGLREIEQDSSSIAYHEALLKVRQYVALPSLDRTIHPLQEVLEDWEERGYGLYDVTWQKYWLMQYHVHPQAGQSFSYEEWKAGKTSRPIKGKTRRRDKTGVDPCPDPDHVFTTIDLQDEFGEKGVQVIVKIASTELTPDGPSYLGDSWHGDGMLNEHIVATTIYCFEEENITEAKMSFCQRAYMYPDDFIFSQYEAKDLAEIFGGTGVDLEQEKEVQTLGSVKIPEGRMISWPSTLMFRHEPFELIDKSRPGHRRCIILYLVDPNYRICSTRNVPPQRHDWWVQDVLNQIEFVSQGILPREVVEMIAKESEDTHISIDEARKFRLDRMEEETEAWRLVEEAIDNYFWYDY